ncbi:hypothetical protein FOA52_001832 [Chlamydomonas sp. UWO 241]|nr:hypothetical protein FOA52_001832 [Chlamydomonas sp. UWO 241]
MGVADPSAALALARDFKRAGEFTDMAGDDGRGLAVPGIDAGNAEKTAMMQRVLCHPGVFGDLSEDDAARLTMAGVDVTDPAITRALTRMFRRGLGSSESSKLSGEEASQLKAMGVTDLSVVSALARAFKRAGGFSGMAGDDERGLAVPGIDAGSAEKTAAQAQRVLRCPGVIGDLSKDEAARLATAGVDVTDPSVARAKARLFKRGGVAFAVDEQPESVAAAAGQPGASESLKAAPHALKRTGGLGSSL